MSRPHPFLRLGGFAKRHKVLSVVLGAAVAAVAVMPSQLAHADLLSQATSTKANNVIVQFSLPGTDPKTQTTKLPLPHTPPFTLYGNGQMICGHDSASPFTKPAQAATYSLPTSTILNKSQVKTLIQQIVATGFFDLNKEYYNVPIAERQNILQVNLAWGNDYVLYYGDMPPPQAYTDTLNILKTYCQQATNPYTPPAATLHVLKNAAPGNNTVHTVTFDPAVTPTFQTTMYQSAITAGDAAYAKWQTSPTKIPTTSPSPGAGFIKFTSTGATNLENLFASAPQQFISYNGIIYELSIELGMTKAANPLNINYSNLRAKAAQTAPAPNPWLSAAHFPTGPTPVRIVYLLPSDGGDNSRLAEAQSLGQAVHDWYCGVVGSCYNYQGVQVLTGSQTKSAYASDTGACANDYFCSILNTVKSLDPGTVYRSDVDTILVTGWSTGEANANNTCGEANIGDTLAVVDYFEPGCQPGHDMAHEMGHTFGLDHTCDGTLMDGDPVCKYASACEIGSTSEPTCKLDSAQAFTLKYNTPNYFPPAPPPCPTALTAGQTLSPGQCVSSANAQYQLNFSQSNTIGSYLQVYDQLHRKQVWTSHCGPGYLTLQPDGNLVQYIPGINPGFVCWSTGTHGLGGTQVTVQNDGSFQITTASGQLVWNSTQGLVIDPPATLNASEKLLPGEQLFSATDQYRLVLQKDGNLVIYNHQGQSTWATGTSGNTPLYLVMQTDGNLVLYDLTGKALWTTPTRGLGGTHVTMQDDGNLVMFNDAGTAVWNLYTGVIKPPPPPPPPPPSSLTLGQALLPGHSLQSPNGQFRLILQTDGNLVEYTFSNQVVWQSNTYGQTPGYLVIAGNGDWQLYNSANQMIWHNGTFSLCAAQVVLQDDGNTVIKNSGGTSLWSIYTGFLGSNQLSANQSLYGCQYLMSSWQGAYRLVMQPDGNVVDYDGNGNAVWQTGTSGSGADHLSMQGDGNLVLYAGGTPIWYTNTSGMGGTHIVLQVNANLVMFQDSGYAVWSWQTGRTPPPPPPPPPSPMTLLVNQSLQPNQSLIGGYYQLILQPDGNLVIYNNSGGGHRPVWALPGSYGKPPGYLIVQPDGNLVLYTAYNYPFWYVGLGTGSNNYLIMQPDGNLVYYNSLHQPIWQSGTEGM